MAFFFNRSKFWMFNEFVTQNNLFVSLHMTGTSIATQGPDVVINSGFTSPLEFNGANYTSGGYQLVNDEAFEDAANDRAILRSDEIVITNLGSGSSNIAGVLVYRRVTNWSDSIPAWWVEQTAAPSGTDFRIRWNGVAADGDMVLMVDG